jgi:hypothetical protein
MQVLPVFPSPQWMRCLNFLRQGRIYCTMRCLILLRQGEIYRTMYPNLQSLLMQSGAYCTETFKSNLLRALISNLPGMESLPPDSPCLLPVVDSSICLSEYQRNMLHMLPVQLHWSSDLQRVYQGKDLNQSSQLKKFKRYVSYHELCLQIHS